MSYFRFGIKFNIDFSKPAGAKVSTIDADDLIP